VLLLNLHLPSSKRCRRQEQMVAWARCSPGTGNVEAAWRPVLRYAPTAGEFSLMPGVAEQC